MSHLSSIKNHCDMLTYTEQSRFRSSDSTLRKFWSKNRIRRDFRVFRIERSRIASFAKRRSDEKTCSFEVDSSDEDVKVSIVYSICTASRASTRSRREKVDVEYCEENTFTILAREERMRNAMNLRVKEFSSSMRQMNANDDQKKIKRHTWKLRHLDNRDRSLRWFEIWRRLKVFFLFCSRHLISNSTRLSQIVKNVNSILRAQRCRDDDSNMT